MTTLTAQNGSQFYVLDWLRSLGEWFARRKLLSAGLAILLLGSAWATRLVVSSYAGRLSEPIHRGAIIDAVYGIGTVTAYKRFSFNPQVSATVLKSFVREGDSVKKGDPLILTEGGVVHYAPFDGVVNFYPYRTGENAYATTPMMIFTNLKDRYILVSMEQQGALRVKVGQTVKISFDSLRDRVFEGKVSAVYSYASNFYARIDTVDLPEPILPDMTCDVAIVIGTHENALLIPTTAFIKGNVSVKRGRGLPRATPVKLGVVDANQAEVVEGDLQEGDRVMTQTRVEP